MKHVIRQKLAKVAESAKIIDFLSLQHHEVCCFIDDCGFITLQRHLMRKKSIITGIRYLCGGKLSTKLMTNLMILTFTLSTFHSFPATYRPVLHMVYISQLIKYATCCSHYCSANDDFRYCHKCVVDRLLSQGSIALRLEKSFQKFYGRYQDIIEKYQRSVK